MAVLFKTTGNLHPPASPPNPCLQVCALICKSRGAFINPELSSQRLGFCHEERRERHHSWMALTCGWPKLLSHHECTTGIQRATKPRRGVSGCVTMSLCHYVPSPHPFGWCLGQLSHSWDTENPWAERGICPREAQGEGGNPAQPLPRWDHRARSPAQAGEQGQGQPTGSKAPLAWPVQRENTL